MGMEGRPADLDHGGSRLWGTMVASTPVYAGVLYLRADHDPQGWGTICGGILLGTSITLVNWWMERRSS